MSTKIKVMANEAVLDDGNWSCPQNQSMEELLDAITDVFMESNTSYLPDEELAIAEYIVKQLPDSEILSHDYTEDDPEAIY